MEIGLRKGAEGLIVAAGKRIAGESRRVQLAAHFPVLDSVGQLLFDREQVKRQAVARLDIEGLEPRIDKEICRVGVLGRAVVITLHGKLIVGLEVMLPDKVDVLLVVRLLIGGGKQGAAKKEGVTGPAGQHVAREME